MVDQKVNSNDEEDKNMSAGSENVAVANAPQAAPRATISSASFTGQLKWYYTHMFPADLLTRWLSYGETSYLSRREISMTLPNDVYLRWKSFSDTSELQTNLQVQTPIKLDIGAVYNFPPRDKTSIPTALVPIEKELVFDIDMTDYADVMGNLAGGSEMEECDRNWRYMATAAQVLDAALREDFGFKLILWVYSGRRGIHCWVCDDRARRLSNEQRAAIAEYLYIRFEGKDNLGKKQAEVTMPLHPSLARAKRIACDDTFREFVLEEQGMLDTADRVDNMIAMIANPSVRQNLREKLLCDGDVLLGNGVSRWERIERELQKISYADKSLRAMADYILFRYCYPRLDINVSKEINHLLKAPFCVHPKTGRVCVPFRAEDAMKFRPAHAAPLISTLLQEMQKADHATARMNEAISLFKEFVHAVEDDRRQRAKIQALASMDRKNALEIMAG